MIWSFAQVLLNSLISSAANSASFGLSIDHSLQFPVRLTTGMVGEWGRRGWGSAALNEDKFWLRSNPRMWAPETLPEISSASVVTAGPEGNTPMQQNSWSVDRGGGEIILGWKQNMSVRITAFIWELLGLYDERRGEKWGNRTARGGDRLLGAASALKMLDSGAKNTNSFRCPFSCMRNGFPRGLNQTALVVPP